MGKLVAVENVSLDGVMQSPGRPDEDTRGGFTHGGWASTLLGADPEAAQASMAGQGNTVAMLFGHRTYVDLVGHWLAPDIGPNPFTAILRDTPKHVASRSRATRLEHPNSHLLGAGSADGAGPAPGDLDAAGDARIGDTGGWSGELDAVEAVRGLKAATAGDIVLLGSGELVRALAAAGLVDEYVLTIVPLVLGRGTRLFDDTYAPMTVRSSFVSPTGILVATYVVDRAAS